MNFGKPKPDPRLKSYLTEDAQEQFENPPPDLRPVGPRPDRTRGVRTPQLRPKLVFTETPPMERAVETAAKVEAAPPPEQRMEPHCAGTLAEVTSYRLCSEADQRRCCHPLAPKVELVRCPECGRSWRSVS